MDKAHLLCTPMVISLLGVDKGSFRPQENDEQLLGPKVSYLSVYANACYLSNPHNVTMVDHKQDICSHVIA